MPSQSSTVQDWARHHAFAVLAALGVTLATKQLVPLALVGLFSFSWYIWRHQLVETPAGPIPFQKIPANSVTTARIITVCLTGLLFPWLNSFTVGLIGLTILIFDKVDGYLAQRYQTESKVGAYLDMETDAFFICLFSLILYLDGYAGLWVVALGMLRYASTVGLVLLRSQHKKEPRVLVARLVATLVMSALLIPYVTPAWFYTPYLAVAVVCLIFSFAYTFSYTVLQPG
ncbi:MAG: CDP-alcohol phosphatidyltransferase family protein [Anaerolineales bacterium]|nr:CDP-alcohol phosphatidyltransferase family protein [Anaerolineales bacterium]